MSSRRQQEGSHENLAEFGISCDKQPQAVRTQLDKFTCLGNAASNNGTPAADHRNLTREHAGAASCYGAPARNIRLENFHASGNQNKERNVRVARLI